MQAPCSNTECYSGCWYRVNAVALSVNNRRLTPGTDTHKTPVPLVNGPLPLTLFMGRGPRQRYDVGPFPPLNLQERHVFRSRPMSRLRC